MKIAFFGASITQQKSGYVSRFKELNPNFEINQFGYGGMYITDAGVCFIDEVVSTKPEYCFLDWFSPACYRPPEKIKDYLDTIVGKLLDIDCCPIFLFFYRQKMDPGWFEMFDYLKAYAKQYNINHIDLSKLPDANKYLRDSIHTNELGGKKYGEIINQEFHSMLFKESHTKPKQTRFRKIHSLSTPITATQYINLKSDGCSSIIGILQNIGLYTDDVKCFNQNREYVISLKDQWSEKYERSTIKFAFDNFYGDLSIKIPDNKKLVWEKIFYIDDIIQIIDYK